MAGNSPLCESVQVRIKNALHLGEHVRDEEFFMETALPPDAITVPESAKPTSPSCDNQGEGALDNPSSISLNLDLDGSHSNPYTVTSLHAISPSVTKPEVQSIPEALIGNIASSLDDTHPPDLPRYAPALQWIDPGKIRLSAMPNRVEAAFTDESFEALCSSLYINRGNSQPIQVRLIAPTELGPSGALYELISGERRLKAAMKNEQQVLAIVIDTSTSSDSESIAITENINREDLSPYEWGRQLKYLTEQKSAYSMGRLAALTGRDKSVVSRAIELASLPEEIVAAFSSVRDLRYADAKPLIAAYQKDRDNVLVEAALIKDEAANPKGAEVVKRLVAAANGPVAPCNTPEAISIKFEERVIGELSTTKTGGSQILINVQLSDRQRMSLAADVERFVSLRVLRKSTPQPGNSKAKPRKSNLSIAATNPPSSEVAVQAARNEA